KTSTGSAPARWVQASLHAGTGRVKLTHEKCEMDPNNWVKGYIFEANVTSGTENSYGALPSVCACCGSDYTRRRRKSPVRGFRTGFSKMSQILTKELFYKLSGPQVKKQKLVVFSDSREDAAQIANGVERNHYSDL